MRNSISQKTCCIFFFLVLLFLHLHNVEGIIRPAGAREGSSATGQHDIHDQGEEFGVDYTPPSTHPPFLPPPILMRKSDDELGVDNYTPPRTHPPVQPPPILMHNSEDEDDEFSVDYAPPRTHPPLQPPPMHNSGGEDEIGVDYSSPRTLSPKEPPIH
ncbi:PREDICTED: early nodulin-75-like [Prunus mume]|uniref:Early nodulin-75-like n=1 Tax=Prunus mume TaxID=102107 RepID=A0ABM0NQ33_PRUMU|nr:PREDICTED: early nodulin-75-like [Prunus mume]